MLKIIAAHNIISFIHSVITLLTVKTTKQERTGIAHHTGNIINRIMAISAFSLQKIMSHVMRKHVSGICEQQQHQQKKKKIKKNKKGADQTALPR